MTSGIPNGHLLGEKCVSCKKGGLFGYVVATDGVTMNKKKVE